MKTNTNPVSRLVEPLARGLSVAIGWCVLAFAVAMTVEIISRKMFATSFKGMDELGGFILAIAAAAGASYAMAMRAHTRVDVFLVRFPAGVQRWLNTLSLLALAGFAVFAAWRGWTVLEETLEFRSSAPNLEIPLSWPQVVWLLGLGLFAGIAGAYALHAVWLLATGKPGLNSFYGPLSVDEELQGELEALEARSKDKSTT